MKLYAHQKEGIKWLSSKRHCLLADDMGLGKTVQAIIAAKKINARKIQVICPSVIKYNWQEEFMKFAGRKAYVAERNQPHEDKDIVITSYDYAKIFKDEYLTRKNDLLIPDEGHYLKEPKSKRTKDILGSNGLIHNTKRLWALTGTPTPNNASELWIWLYTFGITKLSYEGFINRYCRFKKEGTRFDRLRIIGTNTKTSPELKTMLKKCALRRLKKDVLDLPPVMSNLFYIEADSDNKVLKEHPDLKEKLKLEYNLLCEKLDFHFEGFNEDRILNVLNLMAQSCASLRRYHGLKKVRAVSELIREELESKAYSKIVIFGVHSDVLHYLHEDLKDFGSVIITGKTPSKKRQDYKNRFNTNSKTRVFIGNVKAAGVGISLKGVNELAFIEHSWVPAENNQAIDRARGIGRGNKQTLNIRHFTVRDSLDAKIISALVRKIREIRTFIK
jgi:SWI/SNF-related matrix-associated actin-dependent regulator 1 of chromatin subfamily A